MTDGRMTDGRMTIELLELPMNLVPVTNEIRARGEGGPEKGEVSSDGHLGVISRITRSIILIVTRIPVNQLGLHGGLMLQEERP